MLPGHDPAQVLATIRKAVDDSSISVKSLRPARPSPASPLRPDIVGPIARVVKETWGVPLVPVMETGGTDGLYVRNAGVPTYAVSGIFEDPADIRAHGRDERLDPEQYYGAVGFWDAMLRALAQ